MHFENLLESLNSLNWQAVIAIFVVVWFFTKDVRKAVDNLKISQDTILAEVKAIHKDLKVMNTRISRIEGTVYGQKIYKTIEAED